MKILVAGLASAFLAAGTAGAVATYRTQAGNDLALRPVAEQSTAAATPDQPAARHRPRVRWAPCPAGSVLEQGTCVSDVVRTVVVPAAPQPSASPTSTPTSEPGDDHQSDSDGSEQDDHGGQTQEVEDGDDHGDDDHGDDHGDDPDEDHAEDEDD